MNLPEALQIASVISDAQERISDYNSLQLFRNKDVEQVINKLNGFKREIFEQAHKKYEQFNKYKSDSLHKFDMQRYQNKILNQISYQVSQRHYKNNGRAHAQ